MYPAKKIEFIVGIFMIAGILSFIILAFRMSGLANYTSRHTYTVTANFTDIGDLKVRAPVTIAGVTIGRVMNITLDPNTFKAVVKMDIDAKQVIPVDSTANIYTAGLIGSNYISITPGFEETYLKNGDRIELTNQALILQNLIGKFMFNASSPANKNKK